MEITFFSHPSKESEVHGCGWLPNLSLQTKVIGGGGDGRKNKLCEMKERIAMYV